MSLKVKKNDTVYVTTGRDRGKTGKVLRVLEGEDKVIVEKINFIKRHTRPNPQKNIQGGIVEREAPLPIANVRVICPDCGGRTRVEFRILEDGQKVRSCKKCQGVLDRS
ncbi:MAG TPA: 50S ribosomal protein L24 [Thermoanaerobaculia bacterium]|nr:50S ribosomal protein L24 [Thermoanaerobaculia bacterium]HUM30649.1 50S ribosomal protein L24 [Thermoanaerobaculia bacterium]HXK68943.1 50S ribosomal protein L24 [Thermoanaerobaculia bacterium]